VSLSWLLPGARFRISCDTQLDFIGATLVAGAVTCLVLALQWGENTKAWNDKSIVFVINVSTLSLPQKFKAKLRLVVCFSGIH
jgi:hypothetical protein